MRLLSDLAAADLADMRDEGLQPTDEDVIRLHALALRISAGPETTAFTAPRYGIAGGVVFWQPTAAAYQWYKFAKNHADADARDWLFAFACAYGRRPHFLERLYDPEKIQIELGRFLGSITATREEVARAVFYATTGGRIVKPETPIKKDGRDTAKDAQSPDDKAERERQFLDNLEACLASAAAASGISAHDLLARTPSQLRALVYAAHIQAGLPVSKSNGQAYADYFATVDAIISRLRKERDEREAANAKTPQKE